MSGSRASRRFVLLTVVIVIVSSACGTLLGSADDDGPSNIQIDGGAADGQDGSTSSEGSSDLTDGSSSANDADATNADADVDGGLKASSVVAAPSGRSLFVTANELFYAAGNATGSSVAGVFAITIATGNRQPRRSFNATGFVTTTTPTTVDYWVTIDNGVSGSCELFSFASTDTMGTSLHADSPCNAQLMSLAVDSMYLFELGNGEIRRLVRADPGTQAVIMAATMYGDTEGETGLLWFTDGTGTSLHRMNVDTSVSTFQPTQDLVLRGIALTAASIYVTANGTGSKRYIARFSLSNPSGPPNAIWARPDGVVLEDIAVRTQGGDELYWIEDGVIYKASAL